MHFAATKLIVLLVVVVVIVVVVVVIVVEIIIMIVVVVVLEIRIIVTSLKKVVIIVWLKWDIHHAARAPKGRMSQGGETADALLRRHARPPAGVAPCCHTRQLPSMATQGASRLARATASMPVHPCKDARAPSGTTALATRWREPWPIAETTHETLDALRDPSRRPPEPKNPVEPRLRTHPAAPVELCPETLLANVR